MLMVLSSTKQREYISGVLLSAVGYLYVWLALVVQGKIVSQDCFTLCHGNETVGQAAIAKFDSMRKSYFKQDKSE